MQHRLGDMTLRDIGRSLGRYQPFLITVLAIALIATFMAGGDAQDETIEGPVAGQAQTDTTRTMPSDSGSGDEAGMPTGADGVADAETAEAAAASPQDGTDAAPTGEQTTRQPEQQAVEPAAGALDHPDCDPETGRMKIPSNFSAPCVPPIDDNPGETHKGVTADEITVVRMIGEGNPAAEAILTAAGVDDSDEDVEQQYEEWFEFYETYYEQYGRSINLIHYEVSGEGDEAARADAIHVAEEIGAFASIGSGGHGNPYVDEVTHRGVLCMCTVSQPIGNYHAWAPYVWSTLMASTEAYVHRAEYVGKRLWGNEAVHAGDATMHLEQRRFALIYYETEDEAYKAGADFFEEELATYGAHLTDRIAYIADAARAQEQARTIITRLKEQGITSIIFAGDPFYPIFFTQEATNQQYYPEWIITGSALTDTNLFGRTYDQQQWQNAFGVSMLAADVPEAVSEEFRLYHWHYDREPTARGTYGVIHSPVWLLMNGIHLAGPTLTPETFRDGMFSYPLSGQGMVTAAQRSFGSTIWPWETYLRNDDMTEIWWDPTQEGEDEVGNYGVGMYQYVKGGHRYLPGEWPASDPLVFDPQHSQHTYEELPPSDQHPEYEPKPRDGDG